MSTITIYVYYAGHYGCLPEVAGWFLDQETRNIEAYYAGLCDCDDTQKEDDIFEPEDCDRHAGWPRVALAECIIPMSQLEDWRITPDDVVDLLNESTITINGITRENIECYL